MGSCSAITRERSGDNGRVSDAAGEAESVEAYRLALTAAQRYVRVQLLAGLVKA